MAFGVYRDRLQGATFTICVIAIPICTLATVFRFLGTRRAGRKINFEDWFALIALLSLWVHAATTLWSMCAFYTIAPEKHLQLV